jgi:hypothetical protein
MAAAGSEAFVKRFVILQNIEHYRALLVITTDLERRGVIKKLLIDEEAKLKKYAVSRALNWASPVERPTHQRTEPMHRRGQLTLSNRLSRVGERLSCAGARSRAISICMFG